jgi:5'-deoxynucleotidase YfbR-like HD superfamily hydrolase
VGDDLRPDAELVRMAKKTVATLDELTTLAAARRGWEGVAPFASMATMAAGQFRDALDRHSQERPSRHVAHERLGAWSLTRSGTRFYLLDPKADEVKTIDLAHGLAKRDRWNGVCERLYSSGEHSMKVSRVAKVLAERDRLPADLVRLAEIGGGLHDAAEAYLPDFSRPIKREYPELVEAEEKVQKVIHIAFGLPVALPAEVKLCIDRADDLLQLVESRDETLFNEEVRAMLLYDREIPDWATTPEIEEACVPPAEFFDPDWRVHRAYLERVLASWMEQGRHAEAVATAIENVGQQLGPSAKTYLKELAEPEERRIGAKDFEPPAHLKHLLEGP